jgi:hypothetical protein
MLNNPIWTQLTPGVLKIALYFLLRANYKPTQWYDGVNPVIIPAGSFITSYASAADSCGLSIQQTRDGFAHLERTHFATYRRTHRWTLVTVLNWSTYQATAKCENTAENTISTGQGTTDEEVKKLRSKTCASGDARVPDSSSSESGALFQMEPSQATEAAPSQQERWFTGWWAEYWRHKAKTDARKAFGKKVKTEARFHQVMAATRAQKPEMLAREDDKRPHGATWLNRSQS